MKKHLIITVKGKVQGVWFRKSTQIKARDMGLSGFVRNERDGSVYIEVEGSSDVLTAFVEWCHIGPEQARVEGVEVKEGSVIPFHEFEIRHR